MLDCSRTFQSVDYLRQTLDRMALYKLNVLHLHLTDDEGWRLEIAGLPELTTIGARRGHSSDDLRLQLRRLYELPTIDQLVALGLRSVDRDQYDDMKRLGVGFASTKALLDEGPAAVVERLRAGLRNLLAV